MSTTVITPSQRLRIAIGLAALKYKPPEQSTESYVLDLKHHFCRSATRFISEEYDAWRKRALELEAELHATRATASSEHLELLALKSAFATLEEEKGLGRKASESKKRKRVKKPSQTSYTYAKRLELSSPLWSSRLKLTKPKDKGFAYSGNTESITSPRRPNSTLFSSLHALDVISAGINTTNSTSPPDIALLAAATVKCIDELGALLDHAISPAPDGLRGPTPREAFSGIRRILPHVLQMVVPTLKGARIDPSTVTGFGRPPVESAEGDLVHVHETTTSALDLVLGRVTIGLLLPAIRALVPCTFAKTEGILSTRGLEPPEREFVDGADLVGIIRATLDGLPDAWQYMCITLHDRIALEAVRALASLITDQPFSHVQPARLTPVQRIHRIARKDALHFLCDTALLSLRRSSIAPSGNSEDMLRAALSEALGKLALTQSVREGESGLDLVEEHRVMVILERAWSLGLRVGNINGDTGDAETEANQDKVGARGTGP